MKRPFMLQAVLVILRVALTVYVGLCVVLFVIQRSLIYFPTARSITRGVTLLTLPVDGERVLVSTLPAAGPRALIYFGGNAEDTSLNIPDFRRAFPDTAIYLMHYRGYGDSSGKPTEKALFADGLALFDVAHAAHPEVYVIGRSLGTGVAVYVASQRPVAKLTLVTPFDSLTGVAASHFPYVPVTWLLWDRYESGKYAPQVKAPVTIIAAGNDEVVPRASTELLRTRFKRGQVSYFEIAGAGHNTISDNSDYLQLLKGGP